MGQVLNTGTAQDSQITRTNLGPKRVIAKTPPLPNENDSTCLGSTNSFALTKTFALFILTSAETPLNRRLQERERALTVVKLLGLLGCVISCTWARLAEMHKRRLEGAWSSPSKKGLGLQMRKGQATSTTPVLLRCMHSSNFHLGIVAARLMIESPNTLKHACKWVLW